MHLLFNVIGSIIFSVIAVLFFSFVNPAFGNTHITQTQISGVHTMFNVANTLLLFPFSGAIIFLAKKMSGISGAEKQDESELLHLDDRVLETPSFAVQCAVKEVVRMGRIVEENFQTSLDAIFEKDEEKIRQTFDREKTIDTLCHDITEYLVKICNIHINDHENAVVTSLLQVVGDMERVGDHSENLAELSEMMLEENTSFSEDALAELSEIAKHSLMSFRLSVDALEHSDVQAAHSVVREEDVVDDMESRLRTGHIHRLVKNQCQTASGIVFLDTLTNLERISDHALNIAQVVLEDARMESRHALQGA